MMKFTPKDKLMRFKPKHGLTRLKSKNNFKDKLFSRFGKYSLYKVAKYNDEYVQIAPQSIYESNQVMKCVIVPINSQKRFVVKMEELTNFTL